MPTFPPLSLFLNSAADTRALGESLAQQAFPNGCFYLHGHLGAGKTTLASAFIQSLLPNATVKSPTYTLIESYKICQKLADNKGFSLIHHLDLYRLSHPEELDYCGLRDYTDNSAVFLIEWPEKGYGGDLPVPDIHITLEQVHNNNEARQVTLVAGTQQGHRLLEAIT